MLLFTAFSHHFFLIYFIFVFDAHVLITGPIATHNYQIIVIIYCFLAEEQSGTVVMVFDSGAKGSWFNSTQHSPKFVFIAAQSITASWLVGQTQWMTKTSHSVLIRWNTWMCVLCTPQSGHYGRPAIYI